MYPTYFMSFFVDNFCQILVSGGQVPPSPSMESPLIYKSLLGGHIRAPLVGSSFDQKFYI